MNKSQARASASGCALMESLRRPPCLHKFSFASQSLLISEHCCSAGWFSLDLSPLKCSNSYMTSLQLLQPSPSYFTPPITQTYTHTLTHRFSVHEWQIMVLLFLSLCQQKVNCFKDGKLSKTRSVDIYPIVLLVLAPRKFRSAPFLWLKLKGRNSEVLIGHVFSHEKKAYLQWKKEREKNAKFQNAEEKRGDHPDNGH